MPSSFPIRLLFDVGAIVAGKTREWQDFSQMGTCILPQAVWSELEFLCDRAPEPEIEKIAREFARFYPSSGWQASSLTASHASLKSAKAEDLSKQARLALVVAKCAYGMAETYPNDLVILVSNEQPLINQVKALTVPNLCGITVSALLQWSRTQQRPASITAQMQDMKGMGRVAQKTSSSVRSKAEANPQSVSAKGASTLSQPTSGGKPIAQPSYSGNSSRALKLAPFVMTVSGITLPAIVALGLWYTLQPNSFKKFWQQTGLPGLSSQPTPQKPKPAKK